MKGGRGVRGEVGEGVSRVWRKWGRVSRGRGGGVGEKVWEGVRVSGGGVGCEGRRGRV